MSDVTDSGGPPPHAVLIQIGTAFWGSYMLLVAAQLEIADRLATGAKASSELAAELELHPAALHRFLRTLAGMGLLTEVSSKTFALTPLGEGEAISRCELEELHVAPTER